MLLKNNLLNEPLISIIIPTYNRANLISNTLDSILLQTYANWECIIVDDGSMDNSDEVIQKYLNKDIRFQYFKRPENKLKGPNACRNYGFQQSKGVYINWFDSDDVYLPNALEKFVEILDRNTDAVVTKLEIIDFFTGNKIKESNIICTNIIEDYFTGKIAYYVCGPLWKRNFLEQQKQLFDESIRNLDDWDFNLRMLYSLPKIKYIDIPLIQYRYHENSLSQELIKLNFDEIQSEFFAREKHLSLLKTNKIVDPVILNRYIKNRYKYFFREAMVRNHSRKYFLFKKLIMKQWALSDYKGITKTFFGFVFFSIFDKGYKFLK